MPAESDLYAGCRRAILVLGMHRSGTSALTRVLSLRGAVMPKRGMRPGPDNKGGFWEPSEIVAIHDEILASAGYSWHDVWEFPHSWFGSDVAASFKARLVTALIEDFSNAPLFIVKDPRICRLVPLWLSILEQLHVAPLFVISVRNPLEVAASLEERDAFPDAKSLMLWLRYFLTAEQNTRGLRRSFVAYDHLLRDWRGVVERIGNDLDVSWPCQSRAADIEIENFLSTGMRHHVFEIEEVAIWGNVVPWLNTAFDWATRAATGRVTTPDELDGVYAALKTADLSFKPLFVANEARLAAQAGELERLRAEVLSTGEGAKVLRAEAADLTAEITKRDAKIAEVHQTLAEREAKLGALNQGLAEREAKLVALNQGLAERDRELGRLRDMLSARDANIAMLLSMVSALRASTSWRITAPLRFSKRLLTRFRYNAVGYPLTLCWQVLKSRSGAPLRDWRAHRAIVRTGLFDRDWYIKTNPDIVACGIDPLRHYVAFGAREGRDPSSSFSTRNYLSWNIDVSVAGVNPLAHFILHGAAEGRQGGPTAFPREQLTEPSLTDWSNVHPPESIALPVPSSNPEVSVVILSCGRVDLTLRCLYSIAQQPSLSSVEVIVSDDCSEAPGLDNLTRVMNLTLLRPPQNLGFLKHANWALAKAKGKYLLLLNNDTTLKPGAIDTLVQTARTTPNVGLVGSKLVYPDGRLQEAGGIVWNDGSAWNYGRFDDPDKPEYCYVRDVDYVSGASVLVPRAVWQQLRGFDEIFTPAYYEDTDFAFRLRENGLRVIFQPASVVVHHEGASHGTDINSGVKAHQTENHARFKERWYSTLQSDHFRSGQRIVRARDRSKNRRIALVIDHYVPEPDRDAGSRSMIEVIKGLQAAGWMVKFWPDNLRYDPIYTPKLQQLGVETVYAPWVTSFDVWIFANRHDVDLVFLSRPSVAPKFTRTIRRIIPHTPTIFYGHDLHAARMNMQSRITNDPNLRKQADRMKAVERKIWRGVDLVVYPSQEEVEEIRRLEPGVVARTLVPFCFDEARSLRSPPSSSTIMFVAGFAHAPNVDAALWFVKEIFPLVKREVAAATLWIVGSNPTPTVRNLANDCVEVTGYVTADELTVRYARARVAAVPLRFGAGVKLKVVEAIHEGLPLVTTSVGAQGLTSVDEAAAVVGGSEAFARELVRTPPRRRELGGAIAATT